MLRVAMPTPCLARWLSICGTLTASGIALSCRASDFTLQADGVDEPLDTARGATTSAAVAPAAARSAPSSSTRLAGADARDGAVISQADAYVWDFEDGFSYGADDPDFPVLRDASAAELQTKPVR
jgi:hypothetical protein